MRSGVFSRTGLGELHYARKMRWLVNGFLCLYEDTVTSVWMLVPRPRLSETSRAKRRLHTSIYCQRRARTRPVVTITGLSCRGPARRIHQRKPSGAGYNYYTQLEPDSLPVWHAFVIRHCIDRHRTRRVSIHQRTYCPNWTSRRKRGEANA